jgi:DNA-binding transcriptional LysR family regulator
MPITLPQLRAFAAVSRCGSFTLAADALHRTQPAVTLQVRQMEKALGLKLIDRSTRGLRLTPVGAELVPALSALLDQLDGLLEATDRVRAKRSGLVPIACLPSVASSYLPRRIADFRKKHPGIHFRVKDDLGERVVAMVKGGEVEFGIAEEVHASELETLPLFVEKMSVLFMKGHPIASARRIDVEELSRHSLILMAPGGHVRRIVDTAFAAAGRQAAPMCEVSYMSSAAGMVQAGLGIALLPASGFDARMDPQFKSRVIQAPGFSRSIAILKLKGRTLSPAAEAFVRSLVK